MREPKPIRGARTPLFERLTEPLGHQQEPFRVLDRAELANSVEKELVLLLGSRRATRQDRNGTVIDYGLPDLAQLCAASGTDRQMLGEIISLKIGQFEPRLREVRVEVEQDEANPRAVLCTVEGVLVMESITEPVSFPLLLDVRNGEVAVRNTSPPVHET